MSKTKKQRKEKKWDLIPRKALRMHRFCTYMDWPHRGGRLRHIKDDDIFDLICCNYIRLMKFPLIERKVDQNLN